MAIQGQVTTALEQTVGSGTPLNDLSIIIVDGDFTAGGIRLEIQNPQGSGWLPDPIWSCDFNTQSKFKVGIIRTPDAGVTYRVVAEDIDGEANVYFGP